MKAPKRGLWRPLRYLLLLATAGTVIAANNSWTTKLRFDFADATNWLSAFYSSEPPAAEAPAIVEQPATTAPTLNMDGLLNGSLFARPSASWQLDSSKQIVPMLMAASANGPIVQVNGSNNLPSATFSSGFISYSSAFFGPVPTAPTASGTWRANASGNWSDVTKWGSGVVADGAGNDAAFNTLDITTDVTVTLDTSRTIGSLLVADLNGTHHYTISSSGGSTLTFDSGDQFVDSSLEQMGGSAGDTIAASLLVKNGLQINNFSANPFTISGTIASAATSFQQIVWFNSGTVNVSGNISNGTTGGQIAVVVAGGTVTLTGANSYTGFTEVDGGTLLVNGNNANANGGVYVYPGGTLGGVGTIGGDVQVGGGTITGATAGTVGTLTLQGNVDFSNVETGGGTYLANLSGNLSDLLAITGNMILGGDTTLSIVGAADGVTTYTLATFASHIDEFDFVNGLPSGYSLIYHDTDLQLVPIPEPATWVGGTLALGVIAVAMRRQKKTLKR